MQNPIEGLRPKLEKGFAGAYWRVMALGLGAWARWRGLRDDGRGDGFIDTAIKILIACVIGAVVLAGIRALWTNVIMPNVESEIVNTFR